MNIHIVGSGSLGLLYGGKLAAAGNEVTLWCRREEQADQLNASGITVFDSSGKKFVVQHGLFQAQAISGPPYAIAKADAVLLMLKQHGIEAIAKSLLAKVVHGNRQLFCFQNGVGHMEQLQEWLPEWTLHQAITTEGAKRTDAISVLHAGQGTTTIGTMGQKSDQVNTESDNPLEIELVKRLQGAGFEAFLSNEMEEIIYRKLLINAVINPLTALWRIPNGELLSSAERIAVMKLLYDEAVAVYRAAGLSYGQDMWEQLLSVCKATSGNTSSMLKDVLEGRVTEIAWINGSIVRIGDKFGQAAPNHQLVLQLIEGMNI
ncbi:2-dehydropantoate 2-reductase [Paenibacillus sp. JCM 10914]|uniref:ketopantoate reductase family protein n=1 Tax=Paenibacillus sp. JCM 10914 TaxID=1236974 RepID=UPI0003CC80DF|nr:2-dehydropantoate 2-reductase [Paenibacillus sp. JCM 10914]GAE04233.1 2-dehydropantoate 2-reductase [Paenibacillus sp. JCM 10914]